MWASIMSFLRRFIPSAAISDHYNGQNGIGGGAQRNN